MNSSIDLLYEEPQTRVALPVIDRALVFAFAAGDTARAFERVLENAQVEASSFRADCFSRDLFLEQFIERCLHVRIGGQSFTSCKPYILKILSHPPQALGTVQFRQAILRELCADRRLRTALEQLYLQLRDLRTLLGSGDYNSRLDQNARRLDILRNIAKVFKHMAEGFDSAGSGLCRIAEAGRNVVQSDAYVRLSELLEYEQNLATVDLRVKLGSDGTVRAFELIGHRENVNNRFYASWLGRIWARLDMFLRGYGFSQHEILTRLFDHAFEGIKHALLPLFQLLGDIELHLAALGFMDAAESAHLVASFAEFTQSPTHPMAWEALYNPFLLAEHVDLRPCTVHAAGDAIVVVTGPNSGGKTRLLQSIALTQLLAQCGLPVPAARARLGFRTGLFVSLLDDVRADQEEGRLGMELLRIRRLFEQINIGDMVVLDELCSGTNPSEGEEIFRLVIELLGQLRPQVWLTTHFLQFAAQLRDDRRPEQLAFLQVALDAHDHPTFGFDEGVAKTSLARHTAARLGVTWDELATLVERAKARGGPARASRPPAA